MTDYPLEPQGLKEGDEVVVAGTEVKVGSKVYLPGRDSYRFEMEDHPAVFSSPERPEKQYSFDQAYFQEGYAGDEIGSAASNAETLAELVDEELEMQESRVPVPALDD